MISARDPRIRHLAEMLLVSDQAFVLTGAGISTESGIPDFRSEKTGLYARFNEAIFSSDHFLANPGDFYDFARVFLGDLEACRPNDAHLALARLEARGLVQTVVTQNIDGLHHAAGSRRVHEIHGHLRDVRCLTCGREAPISEARDQLERDGYTVPSCPCGGLQKPTVVFFGDALPPAFRDATAAATQADLCLVLGSSLQVQPAASLPGLGNGPLVIINLGPTPLDEAAELVIREPLGPTLLALEAALDQLQASKGAESGAPLPA